VKPVQVEEPEAKDGLKKVLESDSSIIEDLKD